MARIIPNARFFLHSRGDVAEKIVVDELESLPDDFTVIRNVSISSTGGAYHSELDIAVVTPVGALVILEIKAGDLEEDENGNLYREYNGYEKDVVSQLRSQHRIVLHRLKSHGMRVPLYQYLVLPDGIFQGEGIGIETDRIFDSNSLKQLNNALIAIDMHARGQSGFHLDPEKLTDFLLNHYTIQQNVASISHVLDERCRELASGLATWIPKIRTPLPIMEVEAPAGAGKTQLAIKLLEEANRNRQKAVYINFTLNLAERIRQLPIGVKMSFVGTWHELACDATGNLPDGVAYEELGAFYDQQTELLLEDLHNGRFSWDLIVIDDAQELKNEWIIALTQALSETGSMYILSDPNQRVKEPRIEFEESTYIESFESARVPQAQANEIMVLELTETPLTSCSPYKGESTVIYPAYSNEKGLIKQTEKAIKDAIEAGFSTDQIAVLCCKARSRAVLLGLDSIGKYSLKKPRIETRNGQQQFTEGEILIDTVRRFKGLQAPYVILTEMDFDELGAKEKAMLYLAMTRASMRLAFVPTQAALTALTK